jgi:hypothetical protein
MEDRESRIDKTTDPASTSLLHPWGDREPPIGAKI